ncbi:helix-loop-helix DNA-binding domain protein [Diplogelasinospora grovesii]|uniref:Helix-loop-helix DNA-binding domain protein n=1 Tax=Diplogelasinospora grovesii TaxID=303347 RepID=A0AAN6MZT1_9PEZI|nr:helix-loop-helix DNA-binding domain protein [Diplogelasinospora grovesii]
MDAHTTARAYTDNQSGFDVNEITLSPVTPYSGYGFDFDSWPAAENGLSGSGALSCLPGAFLDDSGSYDYFPRPATSFSAGGHSSSAGSSPLDHGSNPSSPSELPLLTPFGYSPTDEFVFPTIWGGAGEDDESGLWAADFSLFSPATPEDTPITPPPTRKVTVKLDNPKKSGPKMSSKGGNHNIQLRTASRKSKTRKLSTSTSVDTSPVSTVVKRESDDDLMPEERRSRQNHNLVEKHYRNRLNQQFERLLAALPAADQAAGGGSIDVQVRGEGEKDAEKRISKAEVLDMATRRIKLLEKERLQLQQERRELMKNVGLMSTAVAQTQRQHRQQQVGRIQVQGL